MQTKLTMNFIVKKKVITNFYNKNQSREIIHDIMRFKFSTYVLGRNSLSLS